MIQAGIHDGDILVVEKSKQARSGKIVLAIVGSEFLVKRLRKEDDGTIFLQAENPAYPPIRLGEDETLEIWGVCRSVLHNLD